MHLQAVWILIVFEGTVGPFRGFSLRYLRARHPSSLHSNMLFIIFFEEIVDFLAGISVLIRYLARTGHSVFRVEWSFSVVCTFQANSMGPRIQILKFHNFISVPQQTKSGLACLFVKVYRLHPGTHTHTHTTLTRTHTHTPHSLAHTHTHTHPTLTRTHAHTPHSLTHTHHTHSHTHTPGSVPLKKATTYTTHNKRSKQTFMSLAEIEPAIPAIARPPGSTLQCWATLVTPSLTMNVTDRLNKEFIFKKQKTRLFDI
jgi:hypothetical protein